MSNFLKYSMMASAVIALAGTVYADPTIYVTDGAGISGAGYLTSSASGSVTETFTNIDGWTVVATTGTSRPPASGGTDQYPLLNLSISASYNGDGSVGSVLQIYFGSDGFGPSSANVFTALSGNVLSGTGNPIGFTNYVIAGSAVPTVVNPVPIGAHGLASPPPISPSSSGVYSGIAMGGPLTMSSYSLEEDITLLANPGSAGGSGYSISASLNVVPEPSVAALGIIAAGAFGMMRRRR